MKFIAFLAVLMSSYSAYAVGFSCEGITNKKVKVSMEVDSHPMDDAFTLVEYHLTLFGVDYGAGDLLGGHLIEKEIEVSGDSLTEVTFKMDNGMKLVSKDSSCSNDEGAVYEISETGKLAATEICCLAD